MKTYTHLVCYTLTITRFFFSKNGDKWSLYVYLLPIFKQVAFTVGSVCLIPSFSKKN